MDYIADDPSQDPSTEAPVSTAAAPSAPAEPSVDPLLAGLLTDDRNLRRRIVGALLRAVLADRRVT